MTVSGQISCPPAGSYVAVSGQSPVAADSKGERRKLGTSGLRQRHLALVINFSPASGKHIFNTLMAVESMGPPTRTPRLPNAITHAWVMSNYPTARSLYAAPDGWQVLGAF